jgi:hypothetical protein
MKRKTYNTISLLLYKEKEKAEKQNDPEKLTDIIEAEDDLQSNYQLFNER